MFLTGRYIVGGRTATIYAALQCSYRQYSQATHPVSAADSTLAPAAVSATNTSPIIAGGDTPMTRLVFECKTPILCSSTPPYCSLHVNAAQQSQIQVPTRNHPTVALTKNEEITPRTPVAQETIADTAPVPTESPSDTEEN